VYPVHPTEPTVEGLPAFKSVADIPAATLDRISVYLPPAVAVGVLDTFAGKGVSQVWLNPGVGSDAVRARAAELGLPVIDGCSIVDLGFSPADFPDG
jgi:uncharacterized protein